MPVGAPGGFELLSVRLGARLHQPVEVVGAGSTVHIGDLRYELLRRKWLDGSERDTLRVKT
jgi:hypothetical protein